MRLLTEDKVRDLVRAGKKNLEINHDTIITPSARERLNMSKIQLLYPGDTPLQDDSQKSEPPSNASDYSTARQGEFGFTIDEDKVDKLKEQTEYYICEATGGFFKEKPEHMTHLRGNLLVYKNHKRIVFRGKTDSFLAQLALLTAEVSGEEKNLLKQDLEDIHKHTTKLQFCEVSDAPLGEYRLLGLSYTELRDHSHHPQKYYGIDHLFGVGTKGELDMLRVSVIRSLSRELEISCFDAYFNNNRMEREDLITFLNRLSSVFYIVELRIMSGYYGKGGA